MIRLKLINLIVTLSFALSSLNVPEAKIFVFSNHSLFESIPGQEVLVITDKKLGTFVFIDGVNTVHCKEYLETEPVSFQEPGNLLLTIPIDLNQNVNCGFYNFLNEKKFLASCEVNDKYINAIEMSSNVNIKDYKYLRNSREYPLSQEVKDLLKKELNELASSETGKMVFGKIENNKTSYIDPNTVIETPSFYYGFNQRMNTLMYVSIFDKTWNKVIKLPSGKDSMEVYFSPESKIKSFSSISLERLLKLSDKNCKDD